jgi:hypothetical protein
MDLPGWYSYDPSATQWPLDETAHDLLVSRWCEAVFEEAKDDLERNDDVVQIDRAINYLMGKQWVERRPSYKAAPVANRLWTNLVQLISYLTDIRPSFEIKANNKLYDEHAKVLNKMVRAWFMNEDIDMTLAMIIVHAALTIGYGRLIWNPDLKNGEGEMELTALGAMDLIPIRPSHTLQRSLGVIYRAPKPISWFKEKYPLKGYKVPVDKEYSQYLGGPSQAGTGMWGRAWQVLSPQMRRVFGQTTSQARDSAIPMALYREFWIRDSQRNTSNATVWVGDQQREYGYAVQPGQKLYPRGRLMILGGPVVLYDGPNPHYHGQFPFQCLRLNRVPWQFPGLSEFRNQIPLQDVMNNVLAGILDAVKKAVNPQLLAPDNAFGASVKKNLDPNMPNAKIFYSPASIQAPTWGPAPVLPSFVFQTMLYAQQELDSQSGFLDMGSISRRGIVPAGDTLEQLKEGQQTLVRLKVRYIEDFMKQMGQQWVPNAFQFYTLKRRMQLLGSEGLTWEDFDWDPGTMVPYGTPAEEHWKAFTFMMVPGSLLKSARMPQQALMLNLRRMGDMDMKNMLESLDLGGLYDSIKKNLEEEGANILIQAIRQKQAGAAGGGGMLPGAMEKISNATGPSATQTGQIQ